MRERVEVAENAIQRGYTGEGGGRMADGRKAQHVVMKN